MRRRYSLWVSAIVTLAVCAIQGRDASAVIVTDDFSDLNDTANPTWTHLDGTTMSTGQTWDASTGQYQLTAPANGTHPLFPGYSFVGSYTGPTFEDVRVQADFVDFTPTDTQGSIFGIAARLDGDNRSWGNLEDPLQGLKGYGYMYEANANTGRGELVLTLLWPGAYKDIGSQKVTLDNSKDYRLVLEVIGSVVHGQVLELDGSGNVVKLVGEDFRDVVTEPVMDDFDFNESTPETAHELYTSGYSGIWGVGHPFYRDADLTIDNFRAETAVAGDYNRDGAADAADYVAWRKTLGSMGPTGNPPTAFGQLMANGVVAPCNECQVIDEADYQFWVSQFGGSVSGGGAVSAVPEPASLAFGLLGFVCICSRRSRSR
jgi:hypothetical protein